MTAIGAHQQPFEGRSNDWITPVKFIAALGPFDLDPCASSTQPWPCAAQQFTQDVDGLSQPWSGLVWLNPPYGPHVGDWLEKLAEHGNGIAMIFARTDTAHFQRLIFKQPVTILFLHGRPTFCRPDGTLPQANCGGPICLVAYGEEAKARLEKCNLPGCLVRLK